MFTQKTKIVQKFTVALMLTAFAQTSIAGIAAEVRGVSENQKIAYTSPANYYQAPEEYESSMVDINNYVKTVQAPVNLNQSVKITNSAAKVNISLRDSDVKQVLRMFAQKAGLNVVFHSSVEGKVTLDLTNVTLNDAFLMVLRSAELTYVMDGRNLIVASTAKAKDLSFGKQSLAVLPVKYEKAQAVADFLNSNIYSQNISGLSTGNIAVANPATNEVMIFGTAADADAAKKIIDKVDKKPMVNTFKVSHTTPKEMAKLLCNTFVETDEVTSDDDKEDDSSDDSSDDDEVKNVVLGSGVVACRAKVGSSGAGSSSGSSGSGDTTATFNSTPLTITYFKGSAAINVTGGSYEQVKVIKEFIQKNDVKQPMAYIELSIIELNESGSKEFNNAWSLGTPFLSADFSSDGGLRTQDMPIHGPNSFSGSNFLKLQLQYILKNGKGRTLSNPKLMVTNGNKATIDLTSDYVKTIKSEIISSGSSVGGNYATQRTYEIGDDEGLKIEMTPFISRDGYVTLNIKPEFATIKDSVYAYNPESGEDEKQATLLQRRDLKLNNLRIKDGETLIIAGLIKENEQQTISKIPILGDLPVVGVFFRNTKNEKTKEELVIMITPHIVAGDEDIAQYQTQNL